ncbi:hypothetical protein SAMN05428966_11297 [Massilia sp. PDC64]|nr:hypothetical protein [Massilia sp. PDC64]SDF04439.1 hypothetical protein SAMN05428966_11297 [Massilia sp. PDC64]
MKRLAIPFLAAALAFSGAVHAQSKLEPRPLGYKRVADALAALQKNPDAKVSHPGGWTFYAIEKPEVAVWSFVPQGHEAYPAVVRRLVRKTDEGTFVEMKVLCEAKQDACRRLAVHFQQMTEQMQQKLQAMQAQNTQKAQ